MKKFSIKFKHTVRAEYTAVVESDTKASALEAFGKNPFMYVKIDEDYFKEPKRFINVLKIAEIK